MLDTRQNECINVYTMTETTQTPARVWPADIAEAYYLTRDLRHDMTETAAEEFRDWRADIREALKSTTAPDWPAFRESANEICADDGMPALFPECQPAQE